MSFRAIFFFDLGFRLSSALARVARFFGFFALAFFFFAAGLRFFVVFLAGAFFFVFHLTFFFTVFLLALAFFFATPSLPPQAVQASD